ncbi:TcaA 3rd/4th domain-containing protein [Planococcus sp. CAU13]|uniref:TcaA 3rd/4th domain-containing protein n=1 Tax=Planococcus sp. CAU13 TaxID=1541197 RepID=UPI00052FEBAD|nr:zinc-ribbon domain-containing protein [Planococcus sp. CAU13]
MSKFCTNCGHSNDDANRICIECGKPLQQEESRAIREEAEIPRNNAVRNKLSFKSKLVAAIAIILIASFSIFYSWGTKTASADSTISKFFEALQEENAEALSKFVVIPNGKNISISEARAFIDLYKNISPQELEGIATIEKNGKVAGVFDAHKIVLTPQHAYFPFAYDGLILKLNGEEVLKNTDAEGEYMFSGIIPGKYEAELVFDNGELTYEHSFELTVYYQYDPTETTRIDEELPLGTVVFNVDTVGQAVESETKIIVGEEEFPVNSNGQTEELGPFLLDGSMTALAQTSFPWGKATSEEVPIDNYYADIEISQLDEEITEEVLERFVAFMEEDLQAKATRDASVYTFLTPGLVKSYRDEFEKLEGWQSYFKGSLLQVNLDGESVIFWEEGIGIDAEIIYEGANYYGDDEPELSKMRTHATVKFAYDVHSEEWIVKAYWTSDSSSRPFTLEPIRTIEGTKKMYQYKKSVSSVEEESDERDAEEEKTEASGSEDSDEKGKENTAAALQSGIESFMNNYNTLSSNATLTGDASGVTPLITQSGPKRKESIDYIASVFSRGISTEHLGTTVDKVEAIDENRVKVTTAERFIINGTEKSSEKTYVTVNILVKNGDSWLVDELVSTKEI